MRASLVLPVAIASVLRGSNDNVVVDTTAAQQFTFLRSSANATGGPPDCGDKYDKLPDFTKEYGATLTNTVCTHPGYKTSCKVFDETLQCWFRKMVTGHCDDLPSLFKKRNKKLVEDCNNPDTDHLDIWMTHFTEAEKSYWRQNFKAQADNSKLFDTMNKLIPKQLLCSTLHIVDDHCVKYDTVRTKEAR
mmetsp:Transcript_62691/g.168103  ORF Transcript_62691/g.168103 Transcript_62691/m.168103 type:complete len:190 (+) Transcript_62691:53-622(+)